MESLFVEIVEFKLIDGSNPNRSTFGRLTGKACQTRFETGGTVKNRWASSAQSTALTFFKYGLTSSYERKRSFEEFGNRCNQELLF